MVNLCCSYVPSLFDSIPVSKKKERLDFLDLAVASHQIDDAIRYLSTHAIKTQSTSAKLSDKKIFYIPLLHDSVKFAAYSVFASYIYDTSFIDAFAIYLGILGLNQIPKLIFFISTRNDRTIDS